MQRLQTLRLLMVCAVVALSACSKDEKAPKVLSVAEYLHDLDAAKAMVKLAATDPVKYQTDPQHSTHRRLWPRPCPQHVAVLAHQTRVHRDNRPRLLGRQRF